MPGFALLPAAITMVAGPQIISAVVLATSHEARRNSIAFIAGVAAAVGLGTLAAIGLMQLLSGVARGAGHPEADKAITYVLVALLAFVAMRSFLGRKSAEPPKWMSGLQNCEPRTAMKLGFVLFLVMPTDVAMMLSVAGYLKQHQQGIAHAWPFFVLTMLLISVPFLVYLILGKRASEALPRMRDWMDSYSWAINVGICAYFIYSLLR